MVEAYAAEWQTKWRQEQLMGVTKHAWKWFGKKSFCAACLAEETKRRASAE
ncbi:hypothetical protein [Paenibacillus sp.]|uniref:hypothetical protein n=1 Tax=Paenibacillus sp. TaxID=58172 RepID=UPI002D746E6E|nr:hypothetical protein [Paenibacillus sp.]HZG85443.1 hypothetical protein [Paenibacillus sp.]